MKNSVRDLGGAIEVVSHTNISTKEKTTHELIGKDGFKTNLLNEAGEMFLQYDKDLDESNLTIENYEKYIGDDNIRKDVINPVFINSIVKNTGSQKDRIKEKQFYQ